MKLEMTNFQAVAANLVAEGDVCDLACAKPATQPETDTEIAPIIQKLGATSIADIDNLMSELQRRETICNQKGSASEQRQSVTLALQGRLRRR